MIGRLSGRLLEKSAPLLLLDVQGVGYELEASSNTFAALPAIGESVTLRTHLLVREDAQLLFGFINPAERTLFRELLRVSGVGAKLALAILSGLPVDELVACVRDGRPEPLTSVSGVGRRTAERVIVDLRDRLADPAHPAAAAGAAVSAAGADPRGDALRGLEALGYTSAEARRAVQAVASEAGEDSETLLRAALRQLMPG